MRENKARYLYNPLRFPNHVLPRTPPEVLGPCPRFGRPIRSLEVIRNKGRSYLWAYHGRLFGRVDRCYLGPLKARSRVEVDLVALALDALEQYAAKVEREAERLESPERAAHLAFAAERLGAVAEEVLQLAERLSALALKEANRARGKGFRLKGGLAHALLSSQ